MPTMPTTPKSPSTPPVRAILAVVTVAIAAIACGDSPVDPRPTPAMELAVVLNSIERSLTVFPVDSPRAAFTIGLAPEGTPATLAARGATVVVPLGTVPAAAIVDLAERSVVHTVSLPEGSGATGVAFLNDSIALVANSDLNSVTPVNVLRGTSDDAVAVGAYPHAIVAVADTAFILNAELGADFQPDGPGSVTVLAGSPPAVVATITLSGTNPGAGVAGPGGSLYVVNAGRFGAGEGSLSVIDRAALGESAHVPGFGDFPGAAALDADGRLAVASFGYGIALWDTGSGEFLRSPADALAPAGIPSSSGVGFDSDGRMYSLEPECQDPGRAFRLDAEHSVELEVPVGICPVGIAFTAIPTVDG